MDSTRQTTVLFSDVAGSTKLYDTAGDAKAMEAIQRCLERLRKSSEAFGGRVVKTIGDELMVLFPSPDAAAGASADMQHAIDALPMVENTKLGVRIENLFDRKYVGSVIVADGNGRFFEPSPRRNAIIGISATLSF